MNTFIRFFYEFIAIFFDGVVKIFEGLFEGIGGMFNFSDYSEVVSSYGKSFTTIEWVLAVLSILLVLAIVIGGLILIFFFIRRILNLRKSGTNQEELLEEIAKLHTQVRKLMKEKDELMAMKVSQLGLSPDDDGNIDQGNSDEEVDTSNSRFPKMTAIDDKFDNVPVKKYDLDTNLEQLVEDFRCFSASKLKLYYAPGLLRAFIGGLACGKLIILQGISGTGKTSLAYAWGKFVNNDSCVASVQPSWKDKTELLGYFNEFTKKFNETEVLGELYRANYDDNIHTIILDEMNIARVEYYFAELLSVLEIPARDEWIIELTTSGWDTDPKMIDRGRLKLPGNLWYIGTINNDDSTYAVTDKVYDRAMPIDINEKIDPFTCREQDPININSTYLESLFEESLKNVTISNEMMDKVKELDNFVIEHFRISFGNRIMKQLKVFVSVYVSCGGTETDAVDYFISKKILRKFEQLNLAFIQDEFDPFISYLNKNFGKNAMKECIKYTEILKKSI